MAKLNKKNFLTWITFQNFEARESNLDSISLGEMPSIPCGDLQLKANTYVLCHVQVGIPLLPASLPSTLQTQKCMVRPAQLPQVSLKNLNLLWCHTCKGAYRGQVFITTDFIYLFGRDRILGFELRALLLPGRCSTS